MKDRHIVDNVESHSPRHSPDAAMKPRVPEPSISPVETVEALTAQLDAAMEEATEWRYRAEDLEEEIRQVKKQHDALRSQASGPEGKEDKTVLALGKLHSQKDLLQSQLRQRDQGLALWKKREQEHRSELSQLQERMEEMSVMIRTRDTELQTLRAKENHYKEKMDTLNIKLREASKKQGSGGGSKSLPPVTKFKTLPAKLVPVKTPPKEPEIKMRTAPSKLPAIHKGKGVSRNMALPKLEKCKDTETVVDDTSLGATAGTPCLMAEKWIDREGGEIPLPQVSLFVPPNSVSASVLISMTMTGHEMNRQQQIIAAGLDRYFSPGLQLRLQPHGFRFLRSVFLEMRNTDLDNADTLLVFHKEVDHHVETEWTDVTADCSAKLNRNDVILSLESFSIFETFKLLVPVFVAGVALGRYSMNHMALAVLNKKTSACDIYAYHSPKEKCIVVVCTSQGPSNNNNSTFDRHSDLVLLGRQPTRFELCDQEQLYFYYHGVHKLVANFVFDWAQCQESEGQCFKLPLSAAGGVVPSAVTVRRRVHPAVEEIDVCEVTLEGDRDDVDGLIPPSPVEVLQRHRVRLVKDLDVRQLMAWMRQENIISLREQEEIFAETSTEAKAGHFIDTLTKKGSKGFKVFCHAVRESHSHLAEEIKEISHVA